MVGVFLNQAPQLPGLKITSKYENGGVLGPRVFKSWALAFDMSLRIEKLCQKCGLWWIQALALSPVSEHRNMILSSGSCSIHNTHGDSCDSGCALAVYRL